MEKISSTLELWNPVVPNFSQSPIKALISTGDVSFKYLRVEDSGSLFLSWRSRRWRNKFVFV